jgi:cytochrome c oxidase subunit II
MRKFGVMLLSGALTLGLAACGGAEETKVDDAKTSETVDVKDDAAQTGAQEFTITGNNWDFAADKELVVKKGEKVKINLENAEGVHTIANEELGLDIKADAPGEFTADKAGEFELICSTICGAMEDHEEMKITLKVQE